MVVTVTRKAHFNAAHRLNVAAWSDEENKRFFGLCNNANFHGHNYILDVSVTGEIDPVSGYLIDMKKLQTIIDEEVINRFDHRNLNMDIAEFKDMNPTAENIAVVIWKNIRKRLDAALTLKVKLYETERNIVEYEGK